MSECMSFPKTVEEYMDFYKVVDSEGIYMSKGTELVPVFRMKQWFEHASAQPEIFPKISEILDYLDTTLHPLVSPEHWDVYATLHDMISLLGLERPEIIHCKKCKHWLDIDDGRQKHRMCADIYGDWFCADAERKTDG